jgi:hypothetical protein
VAGCFDYGNEPSGFVKYGKIVESLAASQTRFHSTEPDRNFPNFPLPGCCAPQNLPRSIAAFTAVPIDSLTLSLQPQIYRCSDRIMDSKADYSFLGHDAV